MALQVTAPISLSIPSTKQPIRGQNRAWKEQEPKTRLGKMATVFEFPYFATQEILLSKVSSAASEPREGVKQDLPHMDIYKLNPESV